MTADAETETSPPDSLAALLAEVMTRRGYSSLLELSSHTSIPYSTLWAWQRGTRNQKRPPSVQVLRTFAADFSMPEAVVFRAAGRSYADPGALDGLALEMLELLKSLASDDQARLVRIVAIYAGMSADQRKLAEGVLRALQNPA
jgi:transcriptional regulator with XRE-family HTH domain